MKALLVKIADQLPVIGIVFILITLANWFLYCNRNSINMFGEGLPFLFSNLLLYIGLFLAIAGRFLGNRIKAALG